MNKNKNKGFTWIELLFVMTILAVLAGLLIPGLVPNTQAGLGDNPQIIATNIPAGNIWTNAAYIKLSGAGTLTIQEDVWGLGTTSTNNVILNIFKSNDQTNRISVGSMSLTGAGTLSVSCMSNWYFGSAAYCYIDLNNSPASAAAGAGTNSNVAAWIGPK